MQGRGRAAGHGRGRGRGRGRKRRVLRFLEPCLLLLLREEDSHGYNLLSELESFGFDPEALDPSLVYRALREMESGGWVTSSWDDDSLGPRRRVYQLTESGHARLDGWIEDLSRTRDEIARLIERHERGRKNPG